MSPSDAYGAGMRWRQAERLVAVTVAFLIGSRYEVHTQVTVGYLAALALTPVWLPLILRIRPARLLLYFVALCLASGIGLALWRSSDHDVSLRIAVTVAIELVGVTASCGAMAWAYLKIGAPQTLLSFGIAALLFVNRGSALYSENPWRFGFAVPASIVVLSLAAMTGNKRVQLVALIATMVAAAAGGGRSSTATLAVALIVFLFWSVAGTSFNRRRSVGLASLVLGLVAWTVYNLGEALILEGILGQAAQERSAAQADTSGGLLVGGRPELAATLSLMGRVIWGFGLGVQPNWHDIEIGRIGMATVGYDPINGYVDTYMFGGAFRLHSISGEMWALYGLAGLCLAVCIGWHAVSAVASGTHRWGADALLLYAAMLTLWNLAFSPWLTSIPMVIIVVSLVWFRRLAPNPAELSAPIAEVAPDIPEVR